MSKRFHILFGFLFRSIAMLLNNFMQRDINIFCHAMSITADIEISSLFKPFKKLFSVFQHLVLDIHLFILVT